MLQSELNVVLSLIPASWFVYSFSWQCLFPYTNLNVRNSCYTMSVCSGPWHCPALPHPFSRTSCALLYLIPLLCYQTNLSFVQVSREFWKFVNNFLLVLSPFSSSPHYTLIRIHYWHHGLLQVQNYLIEDANVFPGKDTTSFSLTSPPHRHLLSLHFIWGYVKWAGDAKPKKCSSWFWAAHILRGETPM